MALEFEISRDDGEGGMHVRRVVEDDVGIRDIWGRGGGCDVVVVAIVTLCLSDCADVRERADVSSGNSLISGILHN